MCKHSTQFFLTTLSVLVGCQAPAGTRILEPFIAVAGQYSVLSPALPAPAADTCASCGGKGSVLMDGKTPTKCQACDGTGKTQRSVSTKPPITCKDGSCPLPRSTVR